MTSNSKATTPTDSPTNQVCPECSAELLIKSGSKGAFWACSQYPSCEYTKPLTSHNEVQVVKILDDVCCPECEGDLAVKSGKYGMFIGCTNYPDCHFIVKEDDDEDYESVPCPACDKGELHQRSGKKGKVFYACDQYPKCDFLLNDRPLNHTCPDCQSPLLVLDKNNHQRCINKSCGYTHTEA